MNRNLLIVSEIKLRNSLNLYAIKQCQTLKNFNENLFINIDIINYYYKLLKINFDIQNSLLKIYFCFNYKRISM